MGKIFFNQLAMLVVGKDCCGWGLGRFNSR